MKKIVINILNVFIIFSFSLTTISCDKEDFKNGKPTFVTDDLISEKESSFYWYKPKSEISIDSITKIDQDQFKSLTRNWIKFNRFGFWYKIKPNEKFITDSLLVFEILNPEIDTFEVYQVTTSDSIIKLKTSILRNQLNNWFYINKLNKGDVIYIKVRSHTHYMFAPIVHAIKGYANFYKRFNRKTVIWGSVTGFYFIFVLIAFLFCIKIKFQIKKVFQIIIKQKSWNILFKKNVWKIISIDGKKTFSVFLVSLAGFVPLSVGNGVLFAMFPHISKSYLNYLFPLSIPFLVLAVYKILKLYANTNSSNQSISTKSPQLKIRNLEIKLTLPLIVSGLSLIFLSIYFFCTTLISTNSSLQLLIDLYLFSICIAYLLLIFFPIEILDNPLRITDKSLWANYSIGNTTTIVIKLATIFNLLSVLIYWYISFKCCLFKLDNLFIREIFDLPIHMCSYTLLALIIAMAFIIKEGIFQYVYDDFNKLLSHKGKEAEERIEILKDILTQKIFFENNKHKIIKNLKELKKGIKENTFLTGAINSFEKQQFTIPKLRLNDSGPLKLLPEKIENRMTKEDIILYSELSIEKKLIVSLIIYKLIQVASELPKQEVESRFDLIKLNMTIKKKEEAPKVEFAYVPYNLTISNFIYNRFSPIYNYISEKYHRNEDALQTKFESEIEKIKRQIIEMREDKKNKTLKDLYSWGHSSKKEKFIIEWVKEEEKEEKKD